MKMSASELELRLSDALQNVDYLNEKLDRAYDLIRQIDNSLPSGLESFLASEQLNNWYENGEL